MYIYLELVKNVMEKNAYYYKRLKQWQRWGWNWSVIYSDNSEVSLVTKFGSKSKGE